MQLPVSIHGIAASNRFTDSSTRNFLGGTSVPRVVLHDSPGKIFIKQSVMSDYCGVYSTGMLLSLLGMKTGRNLALSLFGLNHSNPEYRGTPLDKICEILRRTGGLSGVRWRYKRGFRFPAVSRELQNQLTHSGLPTLVWFGVVYSDRMTRSTHIAVVMGVEGDRINLLDPLGVPPRGGERFNVSLTPNKQKDGLFRVNRCFYFVEPKMEVGILRWSPL